MAVYILSPFFLETYIIYQIKKINKGSEDPYLYKMGDCYPSLFKIPSGSSVKNYIDVIGPVINDNFIITAVFLSKFDCVLLVCKFFVFHNQYLQTILYYNSFLRWLVTSRFLIVLYHKPIKKSTLFRIYFHVGSYIISLFYCILYHKKIK